MDCIITENSITEVDEFNQKLLVKKSSKLGGRDYIIPFNLVESIKVVSIGKSYRGIVSHHLVINLKDNKKEFPGYFSLSQQEVIDMASQLSSAIKCEYSVGRSYQKIRANQIIATLAVAAITFLIWNRTVSGDWAIANDHRELAPIMVGLLFLSYFRILRRL